MRLFLASLLFLTAIPLSYAHEGATGIVKERMDKFGEMRGQMRQMKGALGESDLEAIAQITNAMRPFAEQMKTYFPAGSDGAPSEALPSIWQDEAGFEAAIATYNDAIIALNKAALAGDANAAKTGFKALGAACANCHKSYRK